MIPPTFSARASPKAWSPSRSSAAPQSSAAGGVTPPDDWLNWISSVFAVSVRPGMPTRPAPEMLDETAVQRRTSVAAAGFSIATATVPEVIWKPTPFAPMKRWWTESESVVSAAPVRSKVEVWTSTVRVSNVKPISPETKPKMSTFAVPDARSSSWSKVDRVVAAGVVDDHEVVAEGAVAGQVERRRPVERRDRRARHARGGAVDLHARGEEVERQPVDADERAAGEVGAERQPRAVIGRRSRLEDGEGERAAGDAEADPARDADEHVGDGERRSGSASRRRGRARRRGSGRRRPSASRTRSRPGRRRSRRRRR